MIKTHLIYQKKKKKKKIKNHIQEKSNVYKSYRNSKNSDNIYYLRRLKILQENLHNAIEVSKLNYYSRITYKLTHIQENTKAYWTLWKRFFNNKKIGLITHLFHGNEYVTELFNFFLVKQCSLINNSS